MYKFLQNDSFNRVWPETTIIAEFAIKNCAGIIDQTSKSSSESLKQAKFVILLDFSRKKIDPFFLRYGQSLQKSHIRDSRVSPFPIGFFSHLHRANIDPPCYYRGKVSSMKNRTTPPYKSLFSKPFRGSTFSMQNKIDMAK